MTLSKTMRSALIFFVFWLMLSASSAAGAVRFGIYPQAPFLDLNDQHDPSGFIIDSLEYVASKKGWEIKYVFGTKQQIFHQLENSEIDLTVTEREADSTHRFDYSNEPVMLEWAQMYVAKKAGIKSIRDLEGKLLAIAHNDRHGDMLKKRIAELETNCRIIELQDYATVFQYLSDGRVDAGLVNNFFGIQHQTLYEVVVSPVLFKPVSIVFASPIDKNRMLLDSLDAYLAALKDNQNSFYYQSLEKWFGAETGPSAPAWVYWAFVGVLGSLLLVALYNYLLRMQVNVATREIRFHRDNLELMVKERTRELDHAKKEAETANSIKSEFLMNISHELRTPMQAILGYSSLGIDRVDELDREKTISYFESIRFSGDRMLSLVNDLLDISKLESGKMSYKFRRRSVSDLIDQVLQEFEAFSAKEGVVLEFLPPSFDDFAILDEKKIFQVVSNLLFNALKFSQVDSKVTVQLTNSGGYVTVHVIDRAVGVPEEELESIFDKFVQSSATDDGAGGTGLGLAICRQIINDHGGKIGVSNNSEGGATFFISLPISSKKTVASTVC